MSAPCFQPNRLRINPWIACALLCLTLAAPAGAEGYWWHGFGSNFVDAPITCLASLDENVVASGPFNTIGGTPAQGVARWDGIGWHSMATPQLATCVATLDGILYAAFTNGWVMRWNGNSWGAIGTGFSNVLAITEYNGEVVIGSSGGVWRWTGSTWTTIGGGVTSQNRSVSALAVLGDTLVVSGSFTEVGGVPAKGIARWDGSTWSAFGAGTSGGVGALLVHDGTLYIGGNFQFAGSAQASNVARWNGVQFQALGAGLTSPFQNSVKTLSVFQGDLYAGGSFDHSGEAEIDNLARWDGSNWQPVGMDPEQVVEALLVHNGGLYVAGSKRAGNGSGSMNILRFDGATLRSLAGGLDGPVESLQAYNDALVVSGNFLHAGSNQDGPMVSWTDQWLPLLGSRATALGVVQGKLVMGTSGLVLLREGTNWTNLGHIAGSFEDEVYAFAEYQGQLIAGGTDLGRWSGTNWQPLGSGVNGTIRALAVYNGELIVAGDFSQAGGAPAPRIARWNGSTWNSVGWGINGQVRALAIYEGDLIAAGTFTEAGGVAASGIARWDGTEWHGLGSGIGSPFGPIVNDVVVYGQHLVAGGFFTSAGGVSARCVGRWDGTSWSGLQNGTEHEVRALEVFNGSLYMGGQFQTVSGVGSSYLARWIDGGVPVTLLSFSATREGAAAVLGWAVSHDHDLVGFHVYRSVAGGPREQISTTLIAGRAHFEFVDNEAPLGAAEYWLLELDRGGGTTWHGPVVLSPSSGSLRPVKVLASPNPFATTTTITIEATVPVTADIFDLRGARIRRLPVNASDRSALTIAWDGRNDANENLASGIYFLRVEAADVLVWRRLVKVH